MEHLAECSDIESLCTLIKSWNPDNKSLVISHISSAALALPRPVLNQFGRLAESQSSATNIMSFLDHPSHSRSARVDRRFREWTKQSRSDIRVDIRAADPDEDDDLYAVERGHGARERLKWDMFDCRWEFKRADFENALSGTTFVCLRVYQRANCHYPYRVVAARASR